MKLALTLLSFLMMTACASTPSREVASTSSAVDEVVGISICDSQDSAWSCKDVK